MEKAATSQNAAVTTPEAITDVTPGNTHLILWGLAEEYIDQARSLCFIATTQPSSQPAWRKRHQDLIFCAIKCLAACVSLESPSMTQLDRAKTGLRLAQILFDETESLDRCEEEVNKAIIIANRIQGSTALDIQLRLYDLQIQIYIQSKKFRLAKTILGTASTEAATLDLHWWTYHFLLVRAHVCFLMNDIAGSLSTLNQGAAFAEKRGDFDLKMAFWIVAGQYSLMLSNWDQAMSYLLKLAPHMGLDEGLKISPNTIQPAPESSYATATSSSSQQTQQPKLCQSKQLRVFFLILYISCMLRSGGVQKSLAALTALHSALDETRPKDNEELQGIFRISLNYPKQNVHSQHDQNAPWPHLPIKWMSFSQVYCLTYLLSGICSKADMTQPMKAQQFLIEGIKVVDREFSVNDHATSTFSVRRNQRWFSLLMMTMLVHLSDVFLLKYDLASAEETILKATYWSQVCGMWEVFKWRISLSIGMTMHLGGQLDEALDWYGICLSHTQGSHQDPEGYEAKTLAIINTALIHCGERFYDLQKVKDLQMEARARHESNMSANIRCALHILDSWTKEALIPARQHLQEALKLSSALMNTQLRSLTLLLLGNVYLQTHDEQAEKMLMTGFVHAEKTGNQIVAAAAGSCLKGQ
ncbi:cohesin loading factor [Dissophora ornata]|nr:cohesin loading factor [Dissophora ornata]